MKKVIIVLLVVLVCIGSAGSYLHENKGSAETLSHTMAPAGDETLKSSENAIFEESYAAPLSYCSLEEFKQDIRNSKQDASDGAQGIDALKEISSFPVFEDLPADFEFSFVVPTESMGTHYYSHEGDNQLHELVCLTWTEAISVGDKRIGYVELLETEGLKINFNINGNPAVKVIREDFCFYAWTEGGFDMTLMFPPSVLKLHDESIFFNIQVIDVAAK